MGVTKYGNAGAVAVATPGLLSVPEREALVACEDRIRKGLAIFTDVGAALLTIRDGRLYRSTHGTFDEYCAQKWGMTGRRANQLVASTKVVELISGTTVPEINKAQPLSERAARELTPLLDDPDELQKTYEEAAQAAGGTPTGAQVREVIERRNPEVEPGSKRPASPAIVWVASPVAGGRPAQAEVWLDDPARGTVKVVYLASRTGAWVDRDRIVDEPDEDDVDEDLDEPAGPAPTDPAGPADTTQVWMAQARKGLEYHELATAAKTGCDRATRTGTTMELRAALAIGAVQCRRTCFGNEPADAGPVDVDAAAARAAAPWPVVPPPAATSRCVRCNASGALQEMFGGEDGPRCADGDACRARRVQDLAAIAPELVRPVAGDRPVRVVDLDATELDGVRVQVSAGDAVSLILTDSRRPIWRAWRDAEDLDEPVKLALQLGDGDLDELIDMLLAARQHRRERHEAVSA